MKVKKYNFLIILCISLLLSQTAFVFGFGNIVIDGYYDDWEDKPHTEVYQGNNPKSKAINLVSLFKDDENIYVHIIFSEQYSQGIKNLRIEIETNLGDGYFELEESAMYFRDDFSEGSFLEDKSIPAEQMNLILEEIEELEDIEEPEEVEEPEDIEEPEEIEDPEEIEEPEGMEEIEEVEESEESDETIFARDTIKVFDVWLGNSPVSSGFMTIANGKTVEAELYIPLYTINEQVDGIVDISMQIKKLGHQWLLWSGVSTGPYMGIGISLFVVLVAAGYYFKKKHSKKVAEE